jgi:hypothetical protein
MCLSWMKIHSTVQYAIVDDDRHRSTVSQRHQVWFNNSGTRPIGYIIRLQSSPLKHPCEAASVTGIPHHTMSRIRCFLTMYDILKPAILRDLSPPPGRVIEAPLLALRLCYGYILGTHRKLNNRSEKRSPVTPRRSILLFFHPTGRGLRRHLLME